MTDTVIASACIFGVAALAYGVWAAWRRGQVMMLAGINAVVAMIAFMVASRHLAAAIRYNETPMLLYFALQAAIVMAFAALTLHIQVPRFVIVALAAINIVLLAGLAFLLLAFRFTRLI